MYQPDNFENGFFQVYESFEQVPSKNYNDSKPTTQNQNLQCFLCNKPFSFFHGAKICNCCKLHCCSDCIHKLDNIETCSCCYAIQTNPTNYENLKTLHEYFNKFLKSNNWNFTPQQSAILLFLNLLKRDEKYIYERVILSLYKNRRFYIQDSKITPCIQENLFRFMEILKDDQILPICVNLMCDISLYNKMCLQILRHDYDFYRIYLNPKRPELSAAVSRLILIFASNHLLNPDQDPSVKLIAEGCREAAAYITAALATLFRAPSLYEDSVIPASATECIFSLDNLHGLIKNTLKLFDQKSKNSSLAAQYFASLILLKVSESDEGLDELTKHIPMKNVICTAIRLCPRTLGLKKQEGRIAIYLSRMIKNVWLYCEKSSNRDDLLSKFFAEISNFIFDVTDYKPGFERYSYLCTIQSIAIELFDDIMEQENYRSLLMSPPFQEKLKQMKEERRTALEFEQLQKIDFLNVKNNQMEQLTQDQILQIREREKENKKIREQLQEALLKISESEKRTLQLKAQIEKMKGIANNRFANDGNKIKQCEITINELRDEIESKNKEILNLQTIVKSKEDTINHINSQKIDIERDSLTSSRQNQLLLSAKEAEIEANRQILEQKVKSIEEKEKHIEELNKIISQKEQEQSTNMENYQKSLGDLNTKILEKDKAIEARDIEIKRIRSILDEKEKLITETNTIISSLQQTNQAKIDQVRAQYELQIEQLKMKLQEIDVTKESEASETGKDDQVTVLDENVQKLKKKIAEQSEKVSNDKNSEPKEKLMNEIKFLDASDIDELETLEEINSSANSKVLKVAKKIIYVLKILNSKSIEFKQMQNFMAEYEIMNKLNHPNILKSYGIFISDDEKPPMILLEYCPTNLHDAIKNKQLSKVELVCFIYEIASGMKCVHINHIIHRDIKPTNILISKDCHIKVADFGVSKLIISDDESMTTGVGTQKFMAPEIINEEEYDEKVDIYSFGVLMYFILSGGQMPKITITQIGNGKKAEIPSTFTEFSRSLIYSCWDFKPSERPSFEDICNQLRTHTHELLELNESEINEVKIFIENHQKSIQ